MFQGLRSVIYHAPELQRAKDLFGIIETPHFSLESA